MATMSAPERPEKTRDELIADERAAEKRVVVAELEFQLAEAREDDPAVVAEKRDALAAARVESLEIRRLMRGGLEQWTKYLRFEDVRRAQEAAGVSLPMTEA